MKQAHPTLAAIMSVLVLGCVGCGLFGSRSRGSTETGDNCSRRIREGRNHARAGRMAEAAEAFEEATYSDSENPEARFLLARALLEVGQHYRALDELQVANRLRPGHGPQVILLGRLQTEVGRLEDAQRTLSKALAAWPQAPQVHHAVGALRLRQERLGEAERHLTKALRLSPRLDGVSELLGRVLLRLGRTEQAIVAFEDATELQDCDDLALGGLGAALVAAGRPRQGQASFEQAEICTKNRQMATAWGAAIALSYAAEGRYDAAIERLPQGGNLLSTTVANAIVARLELAQRGWETLGCQAHEIVCGRADERLWAGSLLYFVLGAADAAERELRASIAAYDGDPVPRWVLAHALTELGREEEALLELDRAMAWEPPAPIAAAMRELRERLNESDR